MKKKHIKCAFCHKVAMPKSEWCRDHEGKEHKGQWHSTRPPMRIEKAIIDDYETREKA